MSLRPKPQTVITLIALSALTACFLPPALAKMRFGVTDASGRDVIPCKFKGMKYLGGGLYLAQDFDPTNSASVSHQWRLFTRSGSEIKVVVPKGYTLCDVYLPGSSKSKQRMTTLPAGTILKVHNKSYNLCDLKQHLLLPQGRYERIESLGEDMFNVGVYRREPLDIVNHLFNARTGVLKDLQGKQTQWTYRDGAILFHTYGAVQTSGMLDRNGKVLWEGPYDIAEQPVNGEVVGRFAGDEKSAANSFNSKPVLISKDGKIRTPNLDSFGQFTDGYAWALQGIRQGIINRNFQFVTDTTYSSVIPLGSGLYGAQKPEGSKLYLLDKTGNEICALPSDAMKFDLYYPNTQLIACDLKAKPGHEQLAFYDRSGKEVWRGTKEQLSHNRYKCIAPLQKVLQQLANGLSQTEPDRIIKTDIDKAFSPREWRQEATKKGDGDYDLKTLNRGEMLNKLLANYDLIGMPKAKLELLIGKPDRNQYYDLSSGPCGNSWRGLELDYAGKLLKRWRIVDPEHHGTWIGTNVVWQESDNPFNWEYVPKYKK